MAEASSRTSIKPDKLENFVTEVYLAFAEIESRDFGERVRVHEVLTAVVACVERAIMQKNKLTVDELTQDLETIQAANNQNIRDPSKFKALTADDFASHAELYNILGAKLRITYKKFATLDQGRGAGGKRGR